MDKKDVIEFFDRRAANWDAEMVKSDKIIGTILDNAEVSEGMHILDVACGTGVMFEYYLQRGAASVTGIDISPEMAKIAADKYAHEERISVLCADVEEAVFDKKFDRVVVYNAFPHFPDPRRLIKTLAGLLKDDGRLTIAHGSSRAVIDGHHHGPASKVSNGLMSADSLKKLFDPYFEVEIMISNSKMYQVSGLKRDPLAALSDAEHSHGGLTHSHANGEAGHEHTDGKPRSMRELLLLMKYMVGHNESHAQEVADIARDLRAAGKDIAYDQIMDAVSAFDMVNAKLDAVLKNLTEE